MAHRVALLTCFALHLSLLISFAPMATSSPCDDQHRCELEPDRCNYNVIVKTGAEGNINARIDLKLSDAYANSLTVLDLKSYGSNETGYVYFKSQAEDHFQLKNFPCLNVCAIRVNFDKHKNQGRWTLESVGINTYGKIKTTKSYSVSEDLTKEKACTEVEHCPRVSLWPSFYCL